MLGAGPVAALTGRLLELSGFSVTVLARPCSHQARLFATESGALVVSHDSRPDLQPFSGAMKAEVAFSPESLPQSYRLIFVAVPFHVAKKTLHAVLKAGKVAQESVVVVLSSGLGVSAELASLSKAFPDQRFSVVGFSHFYAAAKFQQEKFVVRAVKKRIHLGGPSAARELLGPYLNTLKTYGVQVKEHDHVLDAECRNLNLYVHSALGMSRHSLEATFSLASHPRYLYKLYPEGPLSPQTMRGYTGLLDELHGLFAYLGRANWNFLEYLQVEGYPVPEVYLKARDVARFPQYSLRRQSELLYARYTGLLVDPYSVPDQDGRYFDFSAVRIASIQDNALPRMPGEELYNLWVARGISRALNLRLPWIGRLLRNFRDVAAGADTNSRLVAVKAWREARRRGLEIGREIVDSHRCPQEAPP